jgi:hypothetical protein
VVLSKYSVLALHNTSIGSSSFANLSSNGLKYPWQTDCLWEDQKPHPTM